MSQLTWPGSLHSDGRSRSRSWFKLTFNLLQFLEEHTWQQWERRRGSGRKHLSLECIVALSDRNAAEEIARKKLVGADTIIAVELSRAELMALNINEGDVRL